MLISFCIIQLLVLVIIINHEVFSSFLPCNHQIIFRVITHDFSFMIISPTFFLIIKDDLHLYVKSFVNNFLLFLWGYRFSHWVKLQVIYEFLFLHKVKINIFFLLVKLERYDWIQSLFYHFFYVFRDVKEFIQISSRLLIMLF